VVAFSPGGSRLVVTTKDRPAAVHVRDLRAIRKGLAGMGLDWDAPAYSDDDPADPSAPPLPPLKVDFGSLTGHLEHLSGPPAELLERFTGRLKSDPNDADAYHHRAHALANLERFPESIDDLTQAIRLRPDDSHFRALRGRIHGSMKRHEPAIADLEVVLARNSDQPEVREQLAMLCNNRAWELAVGPVANRNREAALQSARRAVEVAPEQGIFLNTLGVAQYRSGQYTESIKTLEKSLSIGQGQSDGFDLFFMAMAYHYLGHCTEAGASFDRAVGWVNEHKSLTQQYSEELAAFRVEAEAVLADPPSVLPMDVFAP
jgi:tetratricopeptide (TPR) repeat protein